MKKLCLFFILCFTHLQADTFCSTGIINQNISGIWKGTDSYYYKMTIDKKKHLCIEVQEDGQESLRTIRDIYIENGVLKAFLLFNPAMGTFVLNHSITFPLNQQMNSKWISSYNNLYGEDTLKKQ